MNKKLMRALLALAVLLPAIPAVADHDTPNSYFKPSRFKDPLDIDNPYYPLAPGTYLALTGQETDPTDPGAGAEIRRLEIRVSSVVKKIHGVRTLAVSEKDYVLINGAMFLRENELTFLAQDKRGNVWRFAEYPEEFEESLPAAFNWKSAPNTWVAGREGAIPGLYMRAKPEPGTSPYSLVFAPYGGGFPGMDDQGEVIEAVPSVCLKSGQCFDNVIKVREQNVLQDGDCCQIKYHAAGVGNIKVEAEPEGQGEDLELETFGQLTPSELDALNAEMLALDARAYDPVTNLDKAGPFVEVPVVERLVAELWRETKHAYVR